MMLIHTFFGRSVQCDLTPAEIKVAKATGRPGAFGDVLSFGQKIAAGGERALKSFALAIKDGTFPRAGFKVPMAPGERGRRRQAPKCWRAVHI